MARKPKVTTKVNVEFNQWCIEMAMRWPVVSVYGHGNQLGAAAYQQNLQRYDTDADVIGRANKIKSWVNGSAA